MRIELHVFGSRTGYGTLAATPGLSSADCRLLEGGAYRFGQPDSSDYLESLDRTPACFTRLLPGGRRGLTRVFAGAPDDNHRPTLRMVTAVVSQDDWDHTLGGDICGLLDDDTLWRTQAFDRSADRTPPPPAKKLPRAAVARALAVLTQLETAHERPVVAGESELSFDAVRALEMLTPHCARPRVTTAWRSLSRKLDVTVNALAGNHAAAGAVGAIDYTLPPSPYVRNLIEAGVDRGDLISPLPRITPTFGGSGVSHSAAVGSSTYLPPPKPAKRPANGRRNIYAVGLFLALLSVGGGVFWAVHTRRANDAARRAATQKAADDEKAQRDADLARAKRERAADEQAAAEAREQARAGELARAQAARIAAEAANRAETDAQRADREANERSVEQDRIRRRERQARREKLLQRRKAEREARAAADIDRQFATTQNKPSTSGLLAPATQPASGTAGPAATKPAVSNKGIEKDEP